MCGPSVATVLVRAPGADFGSLAILVIVHEFEGTDAFCDADADPHKALGISVDVARFATCYSPWTKLQHTLGTFPHTL
jgi:hypothetical protein